MALLLLGTRKKICGVPHMVVRCCRCRSRMWARVAHETSLYVCESCDRIRTLADDQRAEDCRVKRHVSLCRLVLALLLTGLCQSANAQVQLMSDAKQFALLDCIPDFYEDEINSILADPNLVLYTDEEMPPAMQAQALHGGVGAPYTRFESIYVSKNGLDRIGLFTNPNREFPWKEPGGTDNGAKFQKEFRFFVLPKRDGGVWPVAVYRAPLDKSSSVNMPIPLGYKWVFPKGTVFGEVLTMRFADDYLYTWEVRTRTREENDWDAAVYRPLPKREDLAKAAETLGYASLAASLRAPVTVKTRTLEDKRHPRRAFVSRAAEYELPELPSALVREILTTVPFERVVGAWYETSDVEVHAPTSRTATESIVPPNYNGAFIGFDRNTCVNCHQHTTAHASRFENRDWYDHVRGSDGIFSWHPIALSSIGRSNAEERPVYLRKAFVEAGMVELYDANKHPSDRYQIAKLYDVRPFKNQPNGGITVSY